MGEAERAYWSIVAQVSPVLALAVVLEVRMLVQSYRTSDPAKSLRVFQLRLLMIVGVAVAYSTSVSLTALSSDRVPGAFNASLVNLALPIGMVVLAVNPLSTVLMGLESGVMARVSTWTVRAAFRRARLRRSISKDARILTRVRSQAFRILADAEQARDEYDALATQLEQRGAPLPDLVETTSWIADTVDRARREHRFAVVRELNYRLWRKEVRRVLREADAEERAMVASRVAVDPVLGARFIGVPTGGQEPDDGGFLSPTPPRPNLPPLSLQRTSLITDASQFYEDEEMAPDGPAAG